MTKLAFLIAFLVALAYLLKKEKEIEPELEPEEPWGDVPFWEPVIVEDNGFSLERDFVERMPHKIKVRIGVDGQPEIEVEP